jgi:hypothetical protein
MKHQPSGFLFCKRPSHDLEPVNILMTTGLPSQSPARRQTQNLGLNLPMHLQLPVAVITSLNVASGLSQGFL